VEEKAKRAADEGGGGMAAALDITAVIICQFQSAFDQILI
jgi:hypothetical protein